MSVLEAEICNEKSIIGFGRGTFVAAPDGAVVVARPPMSGTRCLSIPLAVRAGIEVPRAGIALIPNGPDARNGANTLTGGLIALVAEEAALSLTPGETLGLLDIEFLRAIRVGPAVASAQVHNGVGRVDVRDAGKDNRLAAVATTRVLSLDG